MPALQMTTIQLQQHIAQSNRTNQAQTLNILEIDTCHK